ncbi:MAG: hypothetical protein K2K93_08710 [Muribaculaceae bacterium]|nr:hypothetical protein [Muribaculaceae bacterium]
MQINRNSLFYGVLSLTACSLLAACVDDKYDLTDIDTTSRVSVNDLTVPIKLKEIKLDKVIKLDDNENISIIPVNGKDAYAIIKVGDINTSSFDIAGIHVDRTDIDEMKVTVPVPSLLPGRNVNKTVQIPAMEKKEYKFTMDNIDDNLLSLESVETVNPLKIEMIMSIPAGIVDANNHVSFDNVKIQIPWGLMANSTMYDPATGILELEPLPVQPDGTASFSFYAYGLNLGDAGKIKEGKLDIEGEVGVTSGDINLDVDPSRIPSDFFFSTKINVSSFDLASFCGDIDYRMNDIQIDPISLSDLPEFLDSPDTKLRIADPSIVVNINNPVGTYDLTGSGKIVLTSEFEDGNSTVVSSETFNILKSGAHLSFGSMNEEYTYVPFDGLGDILTNNNVGGLPKSIKVNLQNIRFFGKAKNFPIGSSIAKAEGDYRFSAPLGFADGSKVIYETEVDDFGEDVMNDVNVKYLKVSAKCTTDLPVGIKLSVIPVDKQGNPISVKENSDNFDVQPHSMGTPVSLSIEAPNGYLKDIDGIKFRATVYQDGGNTEPLGPNLTINLEDIQVTVDGYYQTDFN